MADFCLTGARRPRDCLKQAEDTSVNTRKLLRTAQGRGSPWRGSVYVADAIVIAETIECLARYGQTSTAEDATLVVDLVETLSHNLVEIVRDIIADHTQHA